jgi:hypothetical protein
MNTLISQVGTVILEAAGPVSSHETPLCLEDLLEATRVAAPDIAAKARAICDARHSPDDWGPKTCTLCGRQGPTVEETGNDFEGMHLTSEGWRCGDVWTCEGRTGD